MNARQTQVLNHVLDGMEGKLTAAAQLGIKPLDAADYLQSDEDCARYLQACIDETWAGLVAKASTGSARTGVGA